MVFNLKGRKSPSSLHWRDIVRIIEKLGAVHCGDEGDHKKFIRKDHKRAYVIIVPTYKEISSMVLRNIINQSGVSKKLFWDIYFDL